MPSTVLLDIDGTLVDSNDAHARAWVEALREFGFDVPFERVRPLIGKGGDKLIPEVAGISGTEGKGKEMSEWRTRRFLEHHAPALRPFPQVRALLERMRDDGHQLVVATSANEDEFAALMKVAGIEDLLAEQTTKDDADRSKPDPDIIHAALRRGGAEPANTLMLGDTPYDVEAATRADVGVVAVRCGGWDEAGLIGACAIYDDPAALLAAYDDSPFARLGRTSGTTA